jgi:hypothetical protein
VNLVDLCFPRMLNATLGPLRYFWGRWSGNKASLFGHHDVRIYVPGTRREIAPRGMALLSEVQAVYPEVKQNLLGRLYEELDGARDVIEDLPPPVRNASAPETLWSYVTLVHVWVDAYGVQGDVELAYDLAWDDDHTRGITVTNGVVSDYSGSV